MQVALEPVTFVNFRPLKKVILGCLICLQEWLLEDAA